MKRRKGLSLLIALLMVFSCIPSLAFADSQDDVNMGSDMQLNPVVQKDITLEIEQKEFPELKSDQIDFSAYHTTLDAAADLRAKMVLRETNAEIKIKIDEFTNEYVSALVGDMFEEAIKHTGVSNEGDYLKWSCSSYG